MSVLINGVEMPKPGEKRLALFVGSDGVVDVYRSIGEATPYLESYVCETESQQLPPHGRLIDADAFAAKFVAAIPGGIDDLIEKRMAPELVSCIQALLMDIAEAPTIIPADPEGGGDDR